MDVVALVPGRDHVCTRYRIAAFAAHLARAGLRLRLEPLANGAAARFRQMARRRSRQVIFLQRKLLPIWQLTLLRQSTRMLVYDFDDAVFLRDSFHPRGPYSLTRLIRFQATVSLADCVFAGNQFLADAACRFTKSRKVHVIPTCVDPNRYRPAAHRERQPTRLVWIGSSSTVRSLEQARSVLEAVGQEIPGTLLRVICDQFPRFEQIEVESVPWSAATESQDLGSSDIGISWIPDDLWSRGKCGLKVLQYMAAGLPVVASPVGVHCEMVNQGPGFLPTSPREWVETVRLLSLDHRLREQMGREGRSRLQTRFDVERWGPVIAERLCEASAKV
jgi:glycosyltransferase involved in cell wall biosynthesis